MADREPVVAAVPAGDVDDRTLAARAPRDPDAFAELYRRHVGAIHAFAWRRSGSRQVAEDVTSATFERALASIDRFEWKGGGFVAWLHRIAANELAGLQRKEARDQARVLSLVPEPDGDPVDPMADWPRVRAALDRLRPRYQEVIALRYLAGLSTDDAADQLGVTKPVLAVTLHRALKALEREVRR